MEFRVAPTEKEIAVLFANKLLEQPYADPDDDVHILARQFLRGLETFCSICSEPTKVCCSDCRIDLRTCVYVCTKITCQNMHALKCPHELKKKIEELQK